MAWGALAQGLIGLVGESHAREKDRREETLRRQALERILSLPEPELEKWLPELLGPSAAEGVHADPELVAHQKAALARIMAEADGGMNLTDRATLEDALSKSARNDSASRSAIANQFQARGQLGSGAELAMQLQNQQQSSDQAHRIGMKTAGDAQRRALEALFQGGEMAGRMRSQDTNDAFRRADAKDTIARRNAEWGNQAQKYNLGLSQQQFDNRLRQQQAAVAPGSQLADMSKHRAQGERDFYGGLGRAAYEAGRGRGGGGSGGSGVGGYYGSGYDAYGYGQDGVENTDDDFHRTSPSRLWDEDDK